MRYLTVVKRPKTALAVFAVLAMAGALTWGVPADGTKPVQDNPATAQAKALSNAFHRASDAVLPSVVTIQNSPTIAVREQRQSDSSRRQFEQFEGTPFEDFFNDPQFRRFFRELPDGSQGRTPRPTSAGSGVIIDGKGVILTNRHVVDGDGSVMVRLNDGREYKAVEIKTDPMTDLAVVRIEADGLKAAQLGDSEKVQIGDWVLALGQPFGLADTVTAGIISAKGRGIGIMDRESFLQTDAAINPGNSGGPLINLDGEVVGINTAISSNNGGYQGVGFAIPANTAKWVAGQLMANGSVKRAYLGVGIQQMNHDLAGQFGVQAREGVLVTDVFPNTPAEKAGLKSGDIVLDFAGTQIRTPGDLQGAVERTPIGEKRSLKVLRGDKEVTLTIIGTEQPSDFGRRRGARDNSEDEPSQTEPSRFDALGLEVGPLDEEVANQLGMKVAQGVVITGVEPNSPADRAGLSDSMVIAQVNRKPVNSVDQFETAIKNADLSKGVLLLVRTAEGSQFVVVKK
jgi:serine protease Do